MNYRVIYAKELKDGDKFIQGPGIWTVWLGGYKNYDFNPMSGYQSEWGFGHYGYVKAYSSTIYESIGSYTTFQFCDETPIVLVVAPATESEHNTYGK